MLALKRLLYAWNRHGAKGFLWLIRKNISYYLIEILSGRLFRKKESEFDDIYGTDTEGIRTVGSLDIESDNVRYAASYQPSPQNLAKEIIYALPIDYSRFTFIDFGAGKGRVLMIAAELPFADVIGIEFSSELCVIADNNISRLDPKKRKASMIRCEYADVTTYLIPDCPLICYFYNPFDSVVMRTVVDRLLASLKENHRDIYIIYVNPVHRTLFDSVGYWELSDIGEFHVVYRVRSDK